MNSHPDTQRLRAPTVRAYPSDAWTPELIRQAEIASDAGNLRWAAELCDVLLGDDRVQAAREKLSALLGMPLVFEDGVGRARRRARRAIEAEEDWWAAFADESLSELLFWGVLLGVALGELVWTEQRGRYVPRLVVWHPRALRRDLYADRWMVRLADGSEIPIEPGDGKWVLFCPRAEQRPWTQGAWRAISRWWRAKRYALTDWGRHSEQAAGIKVATTEDGANTDREKLAADLVGAGTDAAAVLPAGWDLKQLSVSASTKDVFDALITAANTAIAIALLGQNLTTEVTGGSFAAAGVHQTVSREILAGLASALSSTLRAQVLVPWAVFNWGSPDAAPWPSWQTDPPTDEERDAKVFDTRVRAIATLADRGAPVDWIAVAAEHGVALTQNAPATPRAPTALGAAGEDYIDRLVDASSRSGTAALRPTLVALQGAIARAKSPEELRGALVRLVGNASPDALARELERTHILADLAGRHDLLTEL